MKKHAKKKINKIAEYYGYDKQSRMCIEEMSELIKAINKFWIYQLDCGMETVLDVPEKTQEKENIKEEIADVIITIKNKDINKIIKQKIEKQTKRIRSKK